MELFRNISHREIEVIQFISRGMTSHEIADNLYISHHTVISHRKNAMSKLGAKNQAHLIRLAFERKLLSAS